MIFALLYHPDVQRVDLRRIGARERAMLESAIIERLTTDPLRFGQPLRGSLKGHRRLRVGNYRIVYRVVGNEVRILGIMHRSFVYEAIQSRLA